MRNKPPYAVPTMAEINAIVPTFNVVSTFSGCGGSSLGYRMAGGRVLWASEFVEEARKTYLANCSPSTIVDGRDIRQVQASDILNAIGMKPGELDLFDGSPPCASFSTAGKREKLWGKQKAYSDGKTQRTDDLFAEFIRLVRGIRPKTFVAENVKGLTMGTAKGQFIEIMKSLKATGYNVQAKVIDASWLGVPQARQRTLFVGVRSDLGLSPAWPKPLPYRYTIRDALPYLTSCVHDTKGQFGVGECIDRPSPTITVAGGAACNHFTVVEREADIDGTAIAREWDKMGRPGTQSDRYFQLTRPDPDKPCPTITASGGGRGVAGVCHPTQRRKFSIAEVKALSGVPHDFKLTGTFRQQWERLGRIHCPLAVKAIAEAIRDGVLNKVQR